MSTICKAESPLQTVCLLTGALVLIGCAVVGWTMLTRRRVFTVDPQQEIDRRIDDLEHSLGRLQDVFGHAVGE